MYFDLLAEDRENLDAVGYSPKHWSWQRTAAHQRRLISKSDDVAKVRAKFLRHHGFDTPDKDDEKKARGPARALSCDISELRQAGLAGGEPDMRVFPAGSVALTLRFKLLTPLLTRDDDPFYLFDNPVRKDHVFGVPLLAAASVKGLAVDAFQRGFPARAPWSTLGEAERQRTQRYRTDNDRARRLFGLASDDVEHLSSEAGRLRFQPVWFSHVQYLVMNPAKSDGSGTGTQPIHFEAIAPMTDKNGPMTDKNGAVQAETRLLYFNPAGAAGAALARGDAACLVAALAAWWPALGLGAKRLAGYGAIEPLNAEARLAGEDGILERKGPESWRELAAALAKGAR